VDLNRLLIDALRGLLTELAVGPPGKSAYVLNPGDRGLLESLRALTAAQASARPQGRSSIASHVHHLHHGFTLLNRWARGEDPFADANWSESWQQQQVDEGAWTRLLTALGDEIRQWREAIGSRAWDPAVMSGTIGSVAHLAYHLGAIRQMNAATAGPRETQ
jgi:hypothetical protein